MPSLGLASRRSGRTRVSADWSAAARRPFAGKITPPMLGAPTCTHSSYGSSAYSPVQRLDAKIDSSDTTIASDGTQSRLATTSRSKVRGCWLPGAAEQRASRLSARSWARPPGRMPGQGDRTCHGDRHGRDRRITCSLRCAIRNGPLCSPERITVASASERRSGLLVTATATPGPLTLRWRLGRTSWRAAASRCAARRR